MTTGSDRFETASHAFLGALSAVGVLGCAALGAGTIVGQVLANDYDWVTDTISDLAAGNARAVMDVALYGFAAGLLAVALAAAHAHPGGWSWSLAVLSLGAVAILVTVVSARDEYGDHDAGGVVIHPYLVYALGVLFFLAPLLIARGIRKVNARAAGVLVALAGAWAVLAPAFLLAPTSVDGLIERVLGVVACAMVCTMCYVFSRQGV